MAVLTGATPVRPRAYAWIRCAAVLVAAAVQIIAVRLMAAWLYGRLFRWYRWDSLLLPQALGLWNGSLFSEYPLGLAGLDSAFTLPVAVWAVQVAFALMGILFWQLYWNKAIKTPGRWARGFFHAL